MDKRDPVLQVECSEPEGKIVRSVRLCELTIEKLKMFWERLKDFDILFDDSVRGDLDSFIGNFVVDVGGELAPAGLIWEVDDVGIFLLNDIRMQHSGFAHFAFWDQRFKGRVELCRKMIEYVFETYGLEKVSAAIPVHAFHTLRAVERIGFVREGRLRREVLYKDKWFDVIRYSILRDEAFEPAPRNSVRQCCMDCGTPYIGAPNGIRTPD